MRVLINIIAVVTAMMPGGVSFAETVDTVLVLAVDVSKSVNANRWEVQRGGYAAAFRDREVLLALQSRRVAVTFMQWSSCTEQDQSVGWKVIRHEADALAFADGVSRVERKFAGGTAIGNALKFAKGLIDTSKFKASRRIIDISGDGIEYDDCEYGAPEVLLEEIRPRIVGAGIVINGLPIMIRPPHVDHHNVGIVRYYERRVIGGPGSFVISVDDGDDLDTFRRALVKKLLRELIAMQ